jgi:predicted transcriptional regulator
MIDFACKHFDLDDIIKCGLSLTKAEFEVFRFFLRNRGREMTASDVAEGTGLNLTTVQKAVKKLSEKKAVLRRQKNLDAGGYTYIYQCNSKKNIRGILKAIIRRWSSTVEEKIDCW